MAKGMLPVGMYVCMSGCSVRFAIGFRASDYVVLVSCRTSRILERVCLKHTASIICAVESLTKRRT
jgi:hypothetical protein